MLSQIVTLGLIASLALAQNDVGTYLTVCDEYEGAQMYAEVNRTKGYDGLNTAGYCSSTNTPMAGDKECRSPFLISYFDSSSTSYFQCAQSRPYNCGFFCPLGTSCIATNDYLHEQTFYTCGVTCAGSTYICDDQGAKSLNPNYVAYCDEISDQCATCSSAWFLTGTNGANGGCTQPVTSLPQYPTGTFLGGLLGRSEQCGDCENLPGALAGQVDCFEGACVATACAEGYTLTEGVCLLPEVSRSLRRRSRAVVDMPARNVAERDASAHVVEITNKAQAKKKSFQDITIISTNSTSNGA